MNNELNPASVRLFVSFSAKWKKHESERCIRSQSNLAPMQLNRRLKKEKSLMYELLETSGLDTKVWLPLVFSSRRNTCVYIVWISIISPFQPRMQKSRLTNDLMPDNGAQRKYEGNILCRITSLSVMHFMNSISCIHSGRAQAPGHLYNRAEREREREARRSAIFSKIETRQIRRVLMG